MPLDLLTFVRKWNASRHAERGFHTDHFRDLCEVLEVPHPTQVDEIGASYTYEKRVTKAGTGKPGSADVWKRGWFAWEYKSKGGDFKEAYKQLNEYHEALDNPPLLDVRRIWRNTRGITLGVYWRGASPDNHARIIIH